MEINVSQRMISTVFVSVSRDFSGCFDELGEIFEEAHTSCCTSVDYKIHIDKKIREIV